MGAVGEELNLVLTRWEWKMGAVWAWKGRLRREIEYFDSYALGPQRGARWNKVKKCHVYHYRFIHPWKQT